MNNPAYIRCAGCGRPPQEPDFLLVKIPDGEAYYPSCIRQSQARAHMEEAARLNREEREANEAEKTLVGYGLKVIEGGRHA